VIAYLHSDPLEEGLRQDWLRQAHPADLLLGLEAGSAVVLIVIAYNQDPAGGDEESRVCVK